jgi:hypothetical protein
MGLPVWEALGRAIGEGTLTLVAVLKRLWTG